MNWIQKAANSFGNKRTTTPNPNTLASNLSSTSVHTKVQVPAHQQQPQRIAIEFLENNPYQPRDTMNEESLQQLADTVKSQGFQSVLVARPHLQKPGIFQLTAGHRRRDAAQRAGLSVLPVIAQALY